MIILEFELKKYYCLNYIHNLTIKNLIIYPFGLEYKRERSRERKRKNESEVIPAAVLPDRIKFYRVARCSIIVLVETTSFNLVENNRTLQAYQVALLLENILSNKSTLSRNFITD